MVGMEILQSFRNSITNRHVVARCWKRQGRPVIGWTCTYTPEEVIQAADALPIMVVGDLGGTAQADRYMPDNSCSFVRSCFNAALRGDYDYLDGFVESNSCDNRGKAFDMWARYVKIPKMYFINAPHTNTEKAHAFFYQEVAKFKEWLQRIFSISISDQALGKAIEVYNTNRLLLKKVYDLRMEDPPLISGTEALEISLSSTVTPKEEHNRLLKQLLDQISDRSNLPKKGVRLIVTGSVMDNTELVKIIEAVGGSVVVDDWCTGSRYFWNLVDCSNDPLHAIARRYLDKIPSAFMYNHEARFNHVMEMAKRYDVDAAIIFVLKFCDTQMFDAPLLRDELKAIGLPVLYLEWEHTMSGVAGLKTRIEAFLEMVGGAK
jgi:benzoyl-CoA reductase subunit C